MSFVMNEAKANTVAKTAFQYNGLLNVVDIYRSEAIEKKWRTLWRKVSDNGCLSMLLKYVFAFKAVGKKYLN